MANTPPQQLVLPDPDSEPDTIPDPPADVVLNVPAPPECDTEDIEDEEDGKEVLEVHVDTMELRAGTQSPRKNPPRKHVPRTPTPSPPRSWPSTPAPHNTPVNKPDDEEQRQQEYQKQMAACKLKVQAIKKRRAKEDLEEKEKAKQKAIQEKERKQQIRADRAAAAEQFAEQYTVEAIHGKRGPMPGLGSSAATGNDNPGRGRGRPSTPRWRVPSPRPHSAPSNTLMQYSIGARSELVNRRYGSAIHLPRGPGSSGDGSSQDGYHAFRSDILERYAGYTPPPPEQPENSPQATLPGAVVTPGGNNPAQNVTTPSPDTRRGSRRRTANRTLGEMESAAPAAKRTRINKASAYSVLKRHIAKHPVADEHNTVQVEASVERLRAREAAADEVARSAEHPDHQVPIVMEDAALVEDANVLDMLHLDTFEEVVSASSASFTQTEVARLGSLQTTPAELLELDDDVSSPDHIIDPANVPEDEDGDFEMSQEIGVTLAYYEYNRGPPGQDQNPRRRST